MDVGCEALGAGTSRSDRPLAAANGRKPHAGQPSGTVHVLDAVALESAMERWGDTVLRLATSRMGSVADAEDVFQTVFMRLLQSRERFTDDEHLKAWLLRVTINCCNDVHRSPWSKRRAELDDATLSTLRLASPTATETRSVCEFMLPDSRPMETASSRTCSALERTSPDSVCTLAMIC